LYCSISLREPGDKPPVLTGYDFCEDPAFLGTVVLRLKEAGYDGPSFGRAEQGLQELDCVVLEPTRAFADFAHKTFGWTYAEGMSEWRLGGLREEFSKSFTPCLLKVEALDGSVWTTDLPYVLMVFEQIIDAESKGQPEFKEKVYTDPELRGNLFALKAFLADRAGTAFPLLRPYLYRQKGPTVDPVLQAFVEGSFNLTKS